MDKTLILGASREIADLLNRQLQDYYAETITLTREQAIIALGLAEAVIAQIEREQR